MSLILGDPQEKISGRRVALQIGLRVSGLNLGLGFIGFRVEKSSPSNLIQQDSWWHGVQTGIANVMVTPALQNTNNIYDC